MEKAEVERILREAGWRPTVSAPTNVLDFQRSKPYNRIILWPTDIRAVDEEFLEYLMKTPVENRVSGRVQFNRNPF